MAFKKNGPGCCGCNDCSISISIIEDWRANYFRVTITDATGVAVINNQNATTFGFACSRSDHIIANLTANAIYSVRIVEALSDGTPTGRYDHTASLTAVCGTNYLAYASLNPQHVAIIGCGGGQTGPIAIANGAGVPNADVAMTGSITGEITTGADGTATCEVDGDSLLITTVAKGPCSITVKANGFLDQIYQYDTDPFFNNTKNANCNGGVENGPGYLYLTLSNLAPGYVCDFCSTPLPQTLCATVLGTPCTLNYRGQGVWSGSGTFSMSAYSLITEPDGSYGLSQTATMQNVPFWATYSGGNIGFSAYQGAPIDSTNFFNIKPTLPVVVPADGGDGRYTFSNNYAGCSLGGMSSQNVDQYSSYSITCNPLVAKLNVGQNPKLNTKIYVGEMDVKPCGGSYGQPVQMAPPPTLARQQSTRTRPRGLRAELIVARYSEDISWVEAIQ